LIEQLNWNGERFRQPLEHPLRDNPLQGYAKKLRRSRQHVFVIRSLRNGHAVADQNSNDFADGNAARSGQIVASLRGDLRLDEFDTFEANNVLNLLRQSVCCDLREAKGRRAHADEVLPDAR
jgi:predicted ATPase with chaperone activity